MSFLDFHQNKPAHSTDMPLCEAVFSENNIEKAVQLMSRIIERKFGSKFFALGFEDFKSQIHGKGKGYRLINNSGTQLRFNWTPSKDAFEISSLDFWRTDNTDFAKPSSSTVFGPDLNIVKVIDKIIHDIKRGKLGKFSIKEEGGDINESLPNSTARRAEWLRSKDLPLDKANQPTAVKKIAAKMGEMADYEIFLGKEETNSIITKLQKVEEQYNGTLYANPDTVFQDIEDLVSVVALKYQNSLIVAGGPGIGKTFHVTKKLTEILGTAGKEWVYFKGLKASPLALYANIYLNRDKLLVFDDSDSVLEDADSANMFKGLLDSSGVREASWMSPTSTVNTSTMSTAQYNQFVMDLDDTIAQNPGLIGKGKGKLPSKIFFTGQVIFISNKKASWFDDAIKSRSIFVDVYLHQQDVIRRIRTIALANAQTDGVSADDIDEIIDALTPDTERPKVDVQYITPAFMKSGKPLTIRAYDIAVALRKAKLPNWATLVSLYV
jgi:hypothetical protein